VTRDEAIVKMQRYCTYQDRCHKEVRYKLVSLKVYGDQLEEVMSQLIQDGYLSDERYAKNYARGKYRVKKWGKLRIRRELISKQISSYCIKKALQEIEEEGDYEETLKVVIDKYYYQRKEKYEPHTLRQMTYKHAISKGFESELIVLMLDKLAK